MSKIFFISDSHMAFLIYANRPEINRDNYRAILSVARHVVDDAAEDKAVILCGDNLDSKSPCPADLVALNDAVNVITEAGIPVFGIEGNHDKVAAKIAAGEDDPEDLSAAYGDCGWIDLMPNVTSLNKKEVEICGKRVYGLDYVQGKSIYEELEAVPECDILVLHQPFVHVSPFEANSLEVEGVPSKVSEAVVFGHVHISDKRKSSNGVWVVSPGATHSQKITHPHGAFAVYDTETKDFSFVDTPVHRKMTRATCSDAKELALVEEYVEENQSEDDNLKPIVGVKYAEDLGKDVADLLEKYEGKAHFFPHVVPNDSVQVSAEEVVDLSAKDILSKLFESLGFDERSKDADLYEQTLSLLEGNLSGTMAYIKKMEDMRNEIIGIGTE